jgi:amino acid permease
LIDFASSLSTLHTQRNVTRRDATTQLASPATMSGEISLAEKGEKPAPLEPPPLEAGSVDAHEVVVEDGQGKLHRSLKGRHMQMIAMYEWMNEWKGTRWLDPSGGAIGAGFFVSTASAYTTGGPGSVLLGFMIIGEAGHFNFNW